MDKTALSSFVLQSVQAVPAVLDLLTPQAQSYILLHQPRAVKADGDTASINREYHDAITQALIDYFEGGAIGTSRNDFKRATIQAFGDMFDIGWTDGGQELPVEDEDALGWMEARLNEEVGHVDMLFQEAKELRKDKDFDYFSWITSHADSYVRTLGEIYNAASMLGNKNKMLTWNLGNTETHCATCSKLHGGRHKASWYLSRNYIPRKPGAAMDCGGYHCDCSLSDDEGNEYTI